MMNSLVLGISDKSVSLATRLEISPHYRIAGFVGTVGTSESPHTVAGYPIYNCSSDEAVINLALSLDIRCMIFPSEKEARKHVGGLISLCARHAIKTLVMPSLSEQESGKTRKIREVKIEDLLGRPEIEIPVEELSALFSGKTVLVTGAAGSIGSEICRQCAAFGVGRLIAYDNSETPMHELSLMMGELCTGVEMIPVVGSVRHEDRLDYAFRKWIPDVVFHAAAYKHVPLMESNPCEAVLTNLIGTRNVASKCLEYGTAVMVMISTDKAVNPTNVMGCSKRLAEIYVQSLGTAVSKGSVKGSTRFVTTRFGNVLGSNGSVIPLFRKQIASGGPLTVTHKDIVRYIMTIPEACRLVMEAVLLERQHPNSIFVFDMGDPVKIDSLARNMIELSGFQPDVDIKIEYTGLRPGEKLYEELLSDKETTEPTSFDRIRIAKVREYDYEQVVAVAQELRESADKVDIGNLVRQMKQFVPEFKSSNSPFEQYDNEQTLEKSGAR